MAYIELTQIDGHRAGDPILINTDLIIAVFEEHRPGGSLKCCIGMLSDKIIPVEQSYYEVKKLLSDI